jgi:hypothetical protein
VPSDVHPRSFEPGHLDDFKHRVERKLREVSEPGFGHQDKRLTSFSGKPWNFNVPDGGFEMVVPSTAEICL